MLTPFGSLGNDDGIAQKNGIASRASRSGAACVLVMIRCFPFTRTPETGLLLAPTMSLMKAPDGDCILGSASRSIAALNEAAVTALPSENFVKPASTVKS